MIDERLLQLREDAKKIKEPILRDKTLELLLKISKERKVKRVLEIGTSFGLTGTALLLENPKMQLTTIEINEDKVLIAKQNYKSFGVHDRVRVFLGNASEIIPILSGRFDLIFLDGPKGHYHEYLEYLLPLLDTNGILFADDVYFHGIVLGEAPKSQRTIKNSLQKFIQAITNNENLKTQILDLEDGVSITEKLK